MSAPLAGRLRLSPRARVWALGGLLLALSLAALPGTESASEGRWLLAPAALVVLGLWLARAKKVAGASEADALRVVSRVGLSARCGLALVEVDGVRLLVVYGDTFARFGRPGGPPLRGRAALSAGRRRP